MPPPHRPRARRPRAPLTDHRLSRAPLNRAPEDCSRPLQNQPRDVPTVCCGVGWCSARTYAQVLPSANWACRHSRQDRPHRRPSWGRVPPLAFYCWPRRVGILIDTLSMQALPGRSCVRCPDLTLRAHRAAPSPPRLANHSPSPRPRSPGPACLRVSLSVPVAHLLPPGQQGGRVSRTRTTARGETRPHLHGLVCYAGHGIYLLTVMVQAGRGEGLGASLWSRVLEPRSAWP